MKKKVLFKELKRLYPNAIGFTFYCGGSYCYCVAESKDGKVDITDVFKRVWFNICCSALQKRFS